MTVLIRNGMLSSPRKKGGQVARQEKDRDTPEEQAVANLSGEKMLLRSTVKGGLCIGGLLTGC
jgi:hypothetical protein